LVRKLPTKWRRHFVLAAGNEVRRAASSLSGFAPSMLLKAKSPLQQRHGINQMSHCDSKSQGKI
jgi:hypothetical protein